MAVFGAVALYRMRLRPWMYTCGAGDDEITAVLPGDELVSSHTPRTTGSGLTNLHQRAADASGTFTVEAFPERGTKLRWCAPLP